MALRGITSLVAAFFACGITAMHADVSDRFEIGIHLRVDPSITARRITDRLKNEAEAIWGQYGIRLEWTDADASEAAASSLSLDAIVERRLEGAQRMEGPTVLGRAFVRPDAPNWRPIHVSFDATESVLALRTGRWSTAGIVSDRELARALGRVLAHEIGHMLLGAPDHDRAGLMRAILSSEELAEPDRRPFRLTCSSADRLGSRLRALAGYAPLIPQQVQTRRNVEGLSGTRREFPSDGASCIAIQPTR